MDLPVPSSSRLNTTVKKIASSSWGSWILPRTLNRLDRLVSRLTHISLATIFAGLPVTQLTTRDATSGRPHTVPLVTVPLGKEIILIASNWGRASHPTWYRNLKANPTVSVSYRNQSGEYRAREIEGELRTEYWRKAVEIYPGFDAYQKHSGDRLIPVILLTPKVA